LTMPCPRLNTNGPPLRSSTVCTVRWWSRQSAGRNWMYCGGRRACGDHCGQRGRQQPHVVIGIAVDVEDVHQLWVLVSRPRPPSGPGHQAIITQGKPQPLRTAAADCQVAIDLIVEDVRETVEQIQLFTPGDRAQGQVMLMQSQGVLPGGALLPAPGSAQLVYPGGHERSVHGVHGSALLPHSSGYSASLYPQLINDRSGTACSRTGESCSWPQC
jgi:hypothetical protein